jgi:adenylate kinase
MYIVMMGRPGVGKGTQAKRLAEHQRAQHIATGDLLRDARRDGTPLGLRAAELMDRGDLVPDELVMGLVRERLQDAELVGCIFDGIPRTLEQGKMLDELLAEFDSHVGLAIELEADEEEVTGRMLKRAELEGRADDTPETIKHRMAVYAEQTHPLVEYYRERGVLAELDGLGTPDEVFGRIRDCVGAAPSR